MTLGITLIASALFAVAKASQPGAVAPIAAPLRDLTWGQLNFLHTTDTHGWLGGHLLEPQYSADWGDYISFSEHLKKHADDKGADLLLVDTGDRIEGNGLYDSSTPKGLFQYDIYREQNVDLICIGNHELYQAYSADRELNATVPNFKEQYIASNLDVIDPKTGKRVPLARRYRKFKTKNQGIEILAFGFLFDFTGNANNSFVQKVEDTVKEEWFQSAIREKPDLFVVIGHVGVRMPEFKIIFNAIRKQNWHIPIVFFGGHVHVRDAAQYDSQSFAMASGRYLETLGWMSIDGIKPKGSSSSSTTTTRTLAAPKFTRKYIDSNLYGMYYHSGTNESTFSTPRGTRATNMIARARKALDLDYQYGCAPRDLWVSRASYPGKDSIFSWLENEALPGIVTRPDRKDKARLAILNTGGVRFDIFKGPFTRDSTFIVSPFVSGFNYIPDVPYNVARKVLAILNSAGKILESSPDTSLMAISEQIWANATQPDVVVDSDEDEDGARLELRSISTQGNPPLIGGYTTKDDIGSDGDDTVHEPLKFYAVPNCVQAEIGFPETGEPETVDLVYIDFIQPWIIPALKFAGGDVSSDDVQKYIDGTFTHTMSQWIKENWKGDC